MKKTTRKKISLSRETLHKLEAARLGDVAGAISINCPTTSDQTTCYWFSCPQTCSGRWC